MRIASIIMPMHSDPQFEARRDIIADVERESGWTLLIPDYDPVTPEFDADRAAETLARVSLVIADLSAARPSCYFELGFAEALRKPFQLIAEQGTEIHQTGGRANVISYTDLQGFRDALLTALARHT